MLGREKEYELTRCVNIMVIRQANDCVGNEMYLAAEKP